MSKASRPPSLSPPRADSMKQVATSTTFVHAEKESFREVVQRYTGASDDAEVKLPVTIKGVGVGVGAINGARIGPEALPRSRPMHKLHERRQKSGKEMKLEIKYSPFLFKRNGASPRTSEGLSPTLHDHLLLPPLLSSPVTPLISALSLDSSSPTPSMDLTPLSSTFFNYQNQAHVVDPCSLFSPIMHQTKTQPQPQLLNLFPLTSPRMT